MTHQRKKHFLMAGAALAIAAAPLPWDGILTRARGLGGALGVPPWPLVMWGFAVGLASATPTLVQVKRRLFPKVPVRRPATRWPRSDSYITSLAARLAGEHREMLTEWQAHLAGDEERGPLPYRTRRRYAFGFLLAALRMRASGIGAPLWSPVDWLVSTEARANGASTAAVGSLVVYIQASDGLHTLLTEGWAWCAGCGVAVRILFAWLRRVRGIELAAQRSGEE